MQRRLTSISGFRYITATRTDSVHCYLHIRSVGFDDDRREILPFPDRITACPVPVWFLHECRALVVSRHFGKFLAYKHLLHHQR
jgi:hypothetical protein